MLFFDKKMLQIKKRSKAITFVFGVILILTIVLNSVSILMAQTPNKLKSTQSILVRSYMYVSSNTIWPKKEDISEVKFCTERGHFLYSFFAKELPKKELDGKPINLQFFRINDKENQRKCDIIVLNGDEKLNSQVIENVKGHPVLTISSEEDITKKGGLVYIPSDLEAEKNTPKICIKNLRDTNLKIKTSVLNFSDKVWGKDC